MRKGYTRSNHTKSQHGGWGWEQRLPPPLDKQSLSLKAAFFNCAALVGKPSSCEGQLSKSIWALQTERDE